MRFSLAILLALYLVSCSNTNSVETNNLAECALPSQSTKAQPMVTVSPRKGYASKADACVVISYYLEKSAQSNRNVYQAKDIHIEWQNDHRYSREVNNIFSKWKFTDKNTAGDTKYYQLFMVKSK